MIWIKLLKHISIFSLTFKLTLQLLCAFKTQNSLLGQDTTLTLSTPIPKVLAYTTVDAGKEQDYIPGQHRADACAWYSISQMSLLEYVGMRWHSWYSTCAKNVAKSQRDLTVGLRVEERGILAVVSSRQSGPSLCLVSSVSPVPFSSPSPSSSPLYPSPNPSPPPSLCFLFSLFPSWLVFPSPSPSSFLFLFFLFLSSSGKTPWISCVLEASH